MDKRLVLVSVFVFSLFLVGAFAQNCWEYDNSESDCNAQSDCQWFQDDWGGWCGEKGCWNLWNQDQCTNSSDDLDCLWKSSSSSGWCEETNCYTWKGTDADICVNNSAGLNCQWESQCFGYNSNIDCWTLSTKTECNNVTGCQWGMCEEKGCWNYDYTDQATCESHNGTNGNPCYWEANEEGGYCYEQNCWDYDGTNRSYCEDNPTDLSCQWDSSYDRCEEVECWSFDYTNETQCEVTSAEDYNLTCEWDGQYCMASGCWNYYSESDCNSATKCSWEINTGDGGWCEEIACWSWDQWNDGTASQCENNTYNLSCVWDNGACYANFTTSCGNFTTESDCMDTYYCWWECSDWSDKSTCQCKDPAQEGWETGDEFFDKWNPGCYIFDIGDDLCNASYAGTNESYCENDVSLGVPYDCQWVNDNGQENCLAVPDCNKIVGCSFSASLGVGNCDAAGNEDNEIINITAQEIEDNGINCTMINDTQLCNNIPALSTCCEWKNGACQEKLGKECWENMDKKMEDEYEGIKACADASIFNNPEKKCNEFAGFPLYMPCEWNSSTSKCEFKASQVFGDRSWSFALIQNKKNCEAAGGKWIQEWYCEGNRSVPTGRCEQKADEENNCNAACFACDYKFDGTGWNSTQQAKSACYGSDLGYCEFIIDSTAENGFGKCRAKDEFKSGIATDCTSDCGSCTYMGNPNAATNFDGTKKYSSCNSPKCYCEQAYEFDQVKCKWVPDSSSDEGGYCVDSTTKTCQDACDRCYSKTDCNNNGRKALNATGSCEWVTKSGELSTSDTEGLCRKKGSNEVCWDGIDNDGDGLVDCGDSNCYSDSFCGFVEGDCPSIMSESICTNTQLSNGLNCTWGTDSWGGFCDFPGSNCYSRDGTNATYCEAGGACEWTSESGGGWCEQDWDVAENCWGKMTESACSDAVGCAWTNDTWCNSNPDDQWCQDQGGWCDPEEFVGSSSENCWDRDYTNQTYCQNLTGCSWENSTQLCNDEGCWNYDFNRTACDLEDNCQWQEDDWQSCEVDWTVDCWKYDDNSTACNATAECAWFSDSWGGWCGNKYDKCWDYNDESTCNQHSDTCYWTDWESCEALCYDDTLGESQCNNVDGCTWSSGWCEDSSFGGGSGTLNCWNHTISDDCNIVDGCKWKNPGWCDPKGFTGGGITDSSGSSSGEAGAECWKYDGNEELCTNASAINMACSWISEPWPFCEPDWSSTDCWQGDGTNKTYCEDTLGCWWDDSMGGEGWCVNTFDQCFMNDTLSNNDTLCNANSACNWTTFNSGCRVDWNTVDKCMYYNETECTNVTNSDICVWSDDEYGGMCEGKFEVCFQAMTSEECSNYPDTCFWNMMGGFCDPICFNDLNETTCGNTVGCSYGGGSCEPSSFTISTESECLASGSKWIDGWCNPPGMGKMFKGMDMGAPVMIAEDSCNAQSSNSPYADLCGLGLKDTGKSFTFGSPTADFSEAGICNGENVLTFGSDDFGTGSANQGQGTNTVKYYVYLDTDGSRTGGCSPGDNKTAKGYEFFLKYESIYNDTLQKATSTFTAKKCSSTGSTWNVADISLNTWKQKMCSMIGGPLIAVGKSDLEKFPSLYNSEEDMRIYVAIADSSHNASSPSDTAGPGWFTPGAVDFELQDFFGFGSDSAMNEDIMKKGYVEYEDCYTTGDEDGDGNADCYDWDCQYAKGCENTGVNANNYTDSSMPKITGVKIEEYTDAALIMYSTNKPTNGVLTFYGNDSSCGTANATIFERGMNVSSMREYKSWHDGNIYNDGGVYSLNYDLENNTNYYYKLEVCDSGGKCSVSQCSNFKTAGTRCGYCNFVTLINSPTNWTVFYDLDTDGTYEHEQGSVCGSKAGMKTNYTLGRRANIKLSEDNSVVKMEFLNVTLTKTGLTSKTRKISTSGDLIHDSDEDYIGMPSTTRDKIIKNLHPEVCRITIPTTGGDCSKLYHCDDNGDNCVDRTSEANLTSSSSNSCTWEIPYCEFSTWDADGNPSGTTSSEDTDSSGGGGGSGGGSALTAYAVKVWLALYPETPVTWEINKTNIAITQVDIAVRNQLKTSKLTINNISTRPSSVKSISGAIYQYLNITPQNVETVDLESVKLKFRVEREWITANNIDEDSISLNRYSNGNWDELDTIRVSGDSDYIYYQSSTPGFSIFTITGGTIIAPAQERVTTTISERQVVTTTLPTTPVISPKKTTLTFILALVGLVVIVGVIIFLGFRKKREIKVMDELEEEEEDEE